MARHAAVGAIESLADLTLGRTGSLMLTRSGQLCVVGYLAGLRERRSGLVSADAHEVWTIAAARNGHHHRPEVELKPEEREELDRLARESREAPESPDERQNLMLQLRRVQRNHEPNSAVALTAADFVTALAEQDGSSSDQPRGGGGRERDQWSLPGLAHIPPPSPNPGKPPGNGLPDYTTGGY